MWKDASLSKRMGQRLSLSFGLWPDSVGFTKLFAETELPTGWKAKSFQHRFLLDRPPSTGEQRNLRVLAKIALSLETMYFECFKEIRKALSWVQTTTPLTYIKNFQPLHVCPLISRTVFKYLNLNMTSMKGNFYVWCTLRKYTWCIWASNKTRKWMILKYLSKTNRPTHNRFYQAAKAKYTSTQEQLKRNCSATPYHSQQLWWMKREYHFSFSEFGVLFSPKTNQIGNVSKRGCDRCD